MGLMRDIDKLNRTMSYHHARQTARATRRIADAVDPGGRSGGGLTMTKAALFLLGALTFFIMVLLLVTPTHSQQQPPPLQPVPRPSTVTVTQTYTPNWQSSVPECPPGATGPGHEECGSWSTTTTPPSVDVEPPEGGWVACPPPHAPGWCPPTTVPPTYVPPTTLPPTVAPTLLPQQTVPGVPMVPPPGEGT